ncbi:aldehyde dehydrogenase [Saccharopolyspora griseoalba]|uniref:Aldehyde dehydrogenase n=1 Tax=Saccharopolyspora griseoalba TaxID=1431848 RepID=A0ABW2LRM5_9PSEU
MDFPLLPGEPAIFVAGRWQPVSRTRPVLNPATTETVAEVAEAGPELGEQALLAARGAQRDWARRSGVERGEVLRSVAAAIRANHEELARIVVTEQGKTIGEARGEIGGAATWFEYYAGYDRRATGTVLPSERPDEQLMIRDEPHGVVAAIIPWNFPAALFARKVAPAIMAGNAVVLKPHEDTPLSALALAELCAGAGVPDGVVNVVTGAGRALGDALVRSPRSDLVTVTGSTRAGKEILAAAAETVTPVSLELGGKAPFIVLDDADLDQAVADAAAARLWNCGQVCTCNERTYVHRDVHDEFVARLVEEMRGVRPGDPMAETSRLGPKVNQAEWDKVKSYVDRAVASGAEIACGGGRPEGEEFQRGHWFEPTVLTGLSNDAEIVREEVFGPVLPVIAVDSYEQAVELANDTDYGLTAYVYTGALSTAMRAVDDLAFGEVYVNRVGPEQLHAFHGGWNMSGMGGDDGEHGYQRYLRHKTVYLGH